MTQTLLFDNFSPVEGEIAPKSGTLGMYEIFIYSKIEFCEFFWKNTKNIRKLHVHSTDLPPLVFLHAKLKILVFCRSKKSPRYSRWRQVYWSCRDRYYTGRICPKGSSAGIVFTHGRIFRFFSPRRGDTLHRSRWNLAPFVPNFTLIGSGVWVYGPIT